MSADPLNLDPEIVLRKVLNRARGRARVRTLDFDVDMAHLLSLWREQKGRCAVSGLSFTEEWKGESFVKTPFGPSLDRIDSSKGYMQENVRLVCMAANFALNQWGDDILRRLAHGVVDTERKVHQAWFREQRRKLRRAEKQAATLSGKSLERQKRVIAGLKAAITKGPARLSGAAIHAVISRSADR